MTKRHFLKCLALACVSPAIIQQAEQSLGAVAQDDLVTHDMFELFCKGALNIRAPADCDPAEAEDFDAYLNLQSWEFRMFADGEWLVLWTLPKWRSQTPAIPWSVSESTTTLP